jgi:hypothetical protein
MHYLFAMRSINENEGEQIAEVAKRSGKSTRNISPARCGIVLYWAGGSEISGEICKFWILPLRNQATLVILYMTILLYAW